MTNSNRLLIVGAGIAGLSLAKALQRTGTTFDIIECAPELPEQGAGIYLVGNAMRALGHLGLADAVRAAGAAIPAQRIFNRRGHRLVSVYTASVWGDCGPCVGLRRTDLQAILAGGLEGTPIRFSTTVTAIEQQAEAATVRFDDGSTKDYDLVVGADGIRSSVREMAFGGGGPSYCGQGAWRFLTRCPAAIDTWSLFTGKSEAFLFIPVGNGLAYCYADVTTDAPQADPVDGRLERLRNRFRGFPAPVREALASMTSDDQVHFGLIEEILQVPWSAGNVLLIGDAAHACSPNMASGAALAFEDALVLSELIAGGLDTPAIIAAYTDRRLPRATWIQEQTHKRDRLRKLPPLVRNLLVRLVFQKAYRANYAPMLREI